MGFLLVLFGLKCFGNVAFATPILLGGLALRPPLEASGETGNEHLVTTDLVRLGVVVVNRPGYLHLARGLWRLEFSNGAWKPVSALPVSKLPAPTEISGASSREWLVPVQVLARLGFKFSRRETELVNHILLESQPANKFLVEKLEIEKASTSKLRLVLNGQAEFTSSIEPGFARLRLLNTTTSTQFGSLGTEAISRFRLIQDGDDAVLEAETGLRAALSVQQSQDATKPESSVLEFISSLPEQTSTAFSAEQLAAILPSGANVSEQIVGPSKLWLLRLDANKFMPRIVAAPYGGTRSVAEFASRYNALVAVNGGYFDPASSLPVDLTIAGGQLLSYARGNRTTIAPLGNTWLFGTPKTRLSLQLGAQNIPISVIRAAPHPQWITAFMGDGFVPVGAPGWASLVISHGSVLEVREDTFVPERDQWVVSFKRDAWPKLQARAGDQADVSLTWSDAAWNNTTDVLAAGPKLVSAGKFSIDAKREGFDPQSDLWRSARQVAVGWQDNNYVVAMLQRGTPEEFANALIETGVTEAMRLDSGTSASVCVAGTMLDNRVGRVVPNAIVFVAK